MSANDDFEASMRAWHKAIEAGDTDGAAQHLRAAGVAARQARCEADASVASANMKIVVIACIGIAGAAIAVLTSAYIEGFAK